jgi:RNA polymerase sigma-70 factor (ECF subfamily)
MGEGRREAAADRRRIRRLAAGDAAALAEIYDAHAERIFGLALWITRSRADAEEVVQTVMVKLAGMGDGLRRIRRPAPYILRMARAAALDIAAGRAARREEPVESALFVADGSDPLRAAEASEMESLLARLDAAQREAVYLHLFEGFTFREVGRITGAPTFTAASRYRLALERLRKETSER